MFSPHDSPAVNEWFQRLDAAWRGLPTEERDSQREEIRQHLEGLVAASTALDQSPEAAWKSALARFGDPTQIGRRMYQEWQQGRTGFRADMRAILFGISLYVLGQFTFLLLFSLWLVRFFNPSDTLYTHGRGLVGLPFVIEMLLDYGSAVFINALIGRKYPFQAMKGAFYANVVSDLWSYGSVLVVVYVQQTNQIHHSSVTYAYPTLLTLLWIVGHVAIAYLASVTKRGWYKPTLADFKLTLPRRRPQISR